MALKKSVNQLNNSFTKKNKNFGGGMMDDDSFDEEDLKGEMISSKNFTQLIGALAECLLRDADAAADDDCT